MMIRDSDLLFGPPCTYNRRQQYRKLLTDGVDNKAYIREETYFILIIMK